MIVTVFRSRLNSGVDGEYSQLAERMSALARVTPGYISHKTFTAEDGERVTIVEFDSVQDQLNWRENAEHAEAMQRGETALYSELKVQVCEVLRERESPAP